jgi:glycosyltransferase involved in cell wall biosynthesis
MRIALLTTDNREQHNRYQVEWPYFGPAIESLLQGFEMIGDQVEVHVISCAKRKMVTPEKLGSNIWFHQPIVPHIGWGRTCFLGCAWKVRRLLRSIQPDLVHGQGTERDCSISAVLSGYPNVLTIHGIMQAVALSYKAKPLSYYGMVSALERFAIARSNGVLCNSSYTERWISPKARKTWRVPNCLRMPFLTSPPATQDRPARLVVLGAIAHYKRPLRILELWEKIAERSGDAELVFVGPGEGVGGYTAQFREFLSRPSVRDRARHITWLEPAELIALLDQSRGMIHFPTEESFGLAVAEGLARNLKLFAARTGGIPDVVNGCDGVELFEQDDWSSLEIRIIDWMEAGMPCPDNSERIIRRFSPRAVAELNLQIYKDLLSVYL